MARKNRKKVKTGCLVWLEPAPYNAGHEGLYVVIHNIVPKERYMCMQVHSGWYDTTNVSAHVSELTVLETSAKGLLFPYPD